MDEPHLASDAIKLLSNISNIIQVCRSGRACLVHHLAVSETWPAWLPFLSRGTSPSPLITLALFHHYVLPQGTTRYIVSCKVLIAGLKPLASEQPAFQRRRHSFAESGWPIFLPHSPIRSDMTDRDTRPADKRRQAIADHCQVRRCLSCQARPHARLHIPMHPV